MIEISKKQIFYFIGIGAFIMASLLGFTYFARIVIRDIQIWLNQEPLLNYWITEFSLFVVYILLGIIALRTIKFQKSFTDNKLGKLFIIWIIAFLVSQIMQYYYTIYAFEFLMEYRNVEFTKYYAVMREEYLLVSYQSLFAVLRYLVFAGIIYFAGKSVQNKVSE